MNKIELMNFYVGTRKKKMRRGLNSIGYLYILIDKKVITISNFS